MYHDELSISPVQATAIALAVAAVCLFAPEIAHAAVAVGEIGQNIAENSKGVAKGVVYTGYAGGAAMSVAGLWDLTQAKGNPNLGYGKGALKIFVGACLLGVWAIIGSGSATLFGSDQTSGMTELGF
jgi:hypothetical protein